MSLSALFGGFQRGRAGRVRDEASSYWEQRGLRLRRLLEGGGWTIHDVVNRPGVRAAVREQWRLASLLEEDRAVDDYIGYLEYVEAVSKGAVPRSRRRASSLFSL